MAYLNNRTSDELAEYAALPRQTDIAAALGVAQGTVSKWRDGYGLPVHCVDAAVEWRDAHCEYRPNQGHRGGRGRWDISSSALTLDEQANANRAGTIRAESDSDSASCERCGAGRSMRADEWGDGYYCVQCGHRRYAPPVPPRLRDLAGRL